MSRLYHDRAAYYDLVFGDRPYRSQVAHLQRLIDRFVTAADPMLCDMRCGTGAHLELLAEAGFDVVGVDRSAEMIDRARDRLARFEAATLLCRSDRTVTLPTPANVVLSLFSSLNHCLSDAVVLETLCNYRENLAPDGLLVLDMAPASADHGGVLETEAYTLETEAVEVATRVYEMTRRYEIRTGDEPVRFVDTYAVRFFERAELASLVERAGFDVTVAEARFGDAEDRLLLGATPTT